MLQPGLYQSLPDSQTQTCPWCFHNRLLHISRLVLCAPLRKDPRGYSTRQLPGPLTSAIRGFAPCSLSYTVSFSPSSITHVPTRRSRLGWGAPILLVNYALCPGHAEFSTTLRQVLTLSYTILVSVVGTPRPLASVCTNCLKVKSFTPSGT